MQDQTDQNSQIVLTRPRNISNITAETLKEKGYKIIIEPLFFVKPKNLDHDIFFNKNIQAILISSFNAVFALKKLKAPKQQLILAIGEKTASQIQNLGYQNILIAKNSALSLLKLSEEKLEKNKGEIIYLSGEIITSDLSTLLTKKGFSAKRIVVYETKPRKSLSKQIIKKFKNNNSFQILAYSKNTVSIFYDLLKQDNLLVQCHKMKLLCFSQQISKYAQKLGFKCRILTPNEFD
jgi:uroporphyrinogen-III synthase